MRWIGPALRFALVSLAAYALLLAWRTPYTAAVCLLSNPLLRVVAGAGHAIDWSSKGISVGMGEGRVELGAPFLLVAWPLYLGLCAVRPRVALARPGKVFAGLGLLLALQVFTLLVLSLRYVWGGGHPALGLVKALGLLLVGGQHVMPPAAWWLQFSSEFARRPRGT